MKKNLVSAVFDNPVDADHAVVELRGAGAGDAAISLVARHDGTLVEERDGGPSEFTGKVARGAGIGTLIGIAVFAIPGVGPFLGAGAIAGMALGGAAGGLQKVVTDHGVGDEEAVYYQDRIQEGGVFVSVDTEAAGISPELAADILARAGGQSATRSQAVAA